MSIDNKLKDIEDEYFDLRTVFHDFTQHSSSNASFKNVNESIKRVLRLQSNVELVWEEAYPISEDEKIRYYADRLKQNLDQLRWRIRGQLTDASYLGGVVDRLTDKKYQQALTSYDELRKYLYQVMEDIRLIYSLKTYPIEEKTALILKLGDNGFDDVVRCLDEVDECIVSTHYKDSIDKSIEALEKTVSYILTHNGVTPSNLFNTDISALSGKLEYIDKETKKGITATHSYLSEVSAYGRVRPVTQRDSYYAVKELYLRLEKLVHSYS